ncbi:MAG: dienelactone hydrolase [Paraglaciecola sp.]|jgi:dienelactone hydrolase
MYFDFRKNDVLFYLYTHKEEVSMVRKISLGLVGILGLFLIGLAVTYLATMPGPLPQGSDSEEWLQGGPFVVGSYDFVLVDESRVTMANGDAPGISNRTFPTTIWYPEKGEGDYPLVIHSHGFVSERTDLAYIAELLASHGYVVAAANYPLTAGGTPGGPNADDLVNQPTDVSFLIDSLLQLSGSDKPFAGELDPSRIALMGYSLGGMTTTLATYHPRLRDERVAAAISIAGLSTGLVSKFYETTDVPFMMIAGTFDALIDFEYNAALIPQQVQNSVLIEIEGGTHLGFSSISEPWLRLMNHPDGLGCTAVLSNLSSDPKAPFIPLGDESDGIILDADIPAVCAKMPSEKALHPARQQMVTSIAALSFFEFVFNGDPAKRQAAYEQLSSALPADMTEATFINAY